MSSDEKIKNLQNYEFKLQQILVQKQQIESNFMELTNAMSELENVDSAYEIVGPLMIKRNSADLKKSLSEKKSYFEIKLKAIEKQEQLIKTKANDLQKEILNNMNNNSKKAD